MASKSFPLSLLIGVALIAVGIGLGYWGYDLSQGWSSKLSLKMSGSYSDKEMMLFIGSGACIFSGLVAILKK